MKTFDKAFEALFKAKEIQKQIQIEKPKAEQVQLAISLCSLGLRVRKYTVSIENGKFAIEYLEKRNSEESNSKLSRCYIHVGNAYKAMKDTKEAMAYFSKAYDMKKASLGEEHKETQNVKKMIEKGKKKLMVGTEGAK